MLETFLIPSLISSNLFRTDFVAYKYIHSLNLKLITRFVDKLNERRIIEKQNNSISAITRRRYREFEIKPRSEIWKASHESGFVVDRSFLSKLGGRTEAIKF